jgi:hypothetical protein
MKCQVDAARLSCLKNELEQLLSATPIQIGTVLSKDYDSYNFQEEDKRGRI